MDETEFHKRLKEILSSNRGPNDSPAQQFHDVMSHEVKSRSGKNWDDEVAAQVMREFEWATNTQPKRDDIAESDTKNMFRDFMSERGYTVTYIDEGTDKTPDCMIEKSGSKFIGEIKSPVLNIDIDSQLYKFKTSHSKILDHIHKAVKQFSEHDNEHALPWVLIFTSSHFQLSWKTFTDTLHGGVIDRNGRRLPDFSNTKVYQSTVPLIRQVDAFIWLQANGKTQKFHQASYIINSSSAYSSKTEKFINDMSSVWLSNGMDLNLKLNLQSGNIIITKQ